MSYMTSLICLTKVQKIHIISQGHPWGACLVAPTKFLLNKYFFLFFNQTKSQFFPLKTCNNLIFFS